MAHALRLFLTSLLALARFMRVFFFFNTLGERSLAVLQQRGDGEVPGAHGGDDAHGENGVKRRPRKVESACRHESPVSLASTNYRSLPRPWEELPWWSFFGQE